MGRSPPLLDGSFTAGYSFQESKAILEGFEGQHINQISRGNSVLGDKDRRVIFRQLPKDLGGLPFQGCHQMGFHQSDTKVSLRSLQAQTLLESKAPSSTKVGQRRIPLHRLPRAAWATHFHVL
jgi:hypothetical protein